MQIHASQPIPALFLVGWWVNFWHWLWMSIFFLHSNYHGGVVGYPVGYLEQLAKINGPRDIFIDTQGYMYVGTNGGKIYKASASGGGTVTAIAGGGTVTSGNDIPATSAQISGLFGICGDNSGYLYWTDFNNQVIWSYAGSSSLVNMIVGNYGSPGYTSDGQPAKGNTIRSSFGIILDSLGYLYWAESGNYLVRMAATINKLSLVAILIKGTVEMVVQPPALLSTCFTISTSIAMATSM